MDFNEIVAATEAILFAAGDPVPTGRIAQVLGVPASEVLRAAEFLRNDYEVKGRGIRLLRLEGKLQLCSAPAYSQHVTRALEQRKPPKLSQAAMEVLAVIAYFQPVTRAYIDSVRGVDSAYTVGMLLERGLIEAAGKLETAGRPTLYRTGDAFLRTMNLSSLSELPSLPDTSTDEGIIALQNKIEALRDADAEPDLSSALNALKDAQLDESTQE